MSDDLRLPPHIENRNGAYFNTQSGRWVRNDAIQRVCDSWWFENGEQSDTIVKGNGTVFYKKGNTASLEKKSERRAAYRKQVSLNDFDIVIPPAVTYPREEKVETLKANDMNNVPENFMTIKQYAAACGTSISNPSKRIQRGLLKTVSLNGINYIDTEKYPVVLKWNKGKTKNQVKPVAEKPNSVTNEDHFKAAAEDLVVPVDGTPDQEEARHVFDQPEPQGIPPTEYKPVDKSWGEPLTSQKPSAEKNVFFSLPEYRVPLSDSRVAMLVMPFDFNEKDLRAVQMFIDILYFIKAN